MDDFITKISQNPGMIVVIIGIIGIVGAIVGGIIAKKRSNSGQNAYKAKTKTKL